MRRQKGALLIEPLPHSQVLNSTLLYGVHASEYLIRPPTIILFYCLAGFFLNIQLKYIRRILIYSNSFLVGAFFYFFIHFIVHKSYFAFSSSYVNVMRSYELEESYSSQRIRALRIVSICKIHKIERKKQRHIKLKKLAPLPCLALSSPFPDKNDRLVLSSYCHRHVINIYK